MHLGTIVSHKTQFSGILYPSVRMWANADNLALLPWAVDTQLEFRKAVHVLIKERKETTFEIDYKDEAHEFDASGTLNWLGRIRAWTVQPGQNAKCLFAPGPDLDGDSVLSG